MQTLHSFTGSVVLVAALAAFASVATKAPRETDAPAKPAVSEPSTKLVAATVKMPTTAPNYVSPLDTSTFAGIQSQSSDDDIVLPEPIYFFETECPERLQLVNWTDCVLYFITFLDCDGDGFVDDFDEHFVMPIDEESGVPWVETIEPTDDCQIVYWGLFDILPVGGCEPGWEQDPWFPCAVHFY